MDQPSTPLDLTLTRLNTLHFLVDQQLRLVRSLLQVQLLIVFLLLNMTQMEMSCGQGLQLVTLIVFQ